MTSTITIYTGKHSDELKNTHPDMVYVHQTTQTDAEMVDDGFKAANWEPTGQQIFTNCYAWFTGLRVGLKQHHDPDAHKSFKVVYTDPHNRVYRLEFDRDGCPMPIWPPFFFEGQQNALMELL